MPKTYRYTRSIGKARHVVAFNDGARLHGDGSPQFDMRIFSRVGDAKTFMRALERDGYAPA